VTCSVAARLPFTDLFRPARRIPGHRLPIGGGREFHCAAAIFRTAAWGLQVGQQSLGLGGQLTGQGFQLVERLDDLRGGQVFDRHGGQLVVGGAQRGDRLPYRLDTHDSNVCANPKSSLVRF
jgi:hypothetical protein